MATVAERAMFDASPDAMVAVDAEGIIRAANPRVTHLFGWPACELEGRPVETLIPRRYRPQHPGYRASYFAQPEVRPMGLGRVLDGLHMDGTEFPCEIALSFAPDLGLAIATVRDVASWRRPVQPPNIRPLVWLLVVNVMLQAMTLAAVWAR